jgi:hypothetical protein
LLFGRKDPQQPASFGIEACLPKEDINFLLTNRIPRLYATLLVGWFSRIRSRPLTRLSVALWNVFDDLRLEEARTQDFLCLQDCCTRTSQIHATPLLEHLVPSTETRRFRECRFVCEIFYIELSQHLLRWSLRQDVKRHGTSLFQFFGRCNSHFMTAHTALRNVSTLH